MSNDKAKAGPPKSGASGPAGPLPPLFRQIDWISFGITAFLVFIGYYLTLCPDVTLEDAGELATGSFYAGVPHPPGYPVWTLYTWLFTALVPVSNVAWRVALSSAVAGAVSCGVIALMVSRGSSMILEGIPQLKAIDRRSENPICMVAGCVGGMLLGFNGFMWSQAVIVEVYTLSVLSLVGVLICLMRWLYAPDQRRYLYWAFFIFGICFTNHQTLIVAAMGLEILITVARPKLGRDLFLGNSIIYLMALLAKANGKLPSFDSNPPLLAILHVIGIGSIIACVWLAMRTEGLLSEWKSVLLIGLLWLAGFAFYLYMPIASMTNPPLNWGYPRTVEGFYHALTRGQYERANPTNIIKDPNRFIGQLYQLAIGAMEEFHAVYLLIALIPFLFYRFMQKREKAWVVGLTAVYVCLALLLLIILNPSPDRQSRELNKVFFTASHVIIAMGIGYGMTLICGLMATNYLKFRLAFLNGGAVAAGIALFGLAAAVFKRWGDRSDIAGLKLFVYAARQAVQPDQYVLPILAAVLVLFLALAFVAVILFSRTQIRLGLILGIFSLTPVYSVLSHWAENEQRGHLFGYWFGHDMFSPPFGIYPEMPRNTVLFGGTDPGRFNPTYMIFCESFIPPSKKPLDPKFDRRDVYLITQNALADNTYLSYIRAHYNRSEQIDPPFFQELFHTKLLAPLDTLFTSIGKKVEDRRRAGLVYPPEEIKTPSPDDSQRSFQEYIADAGRRSKATPSQLKPGEDVKVVTDASGVERVQVSGQVAVMAINGLLTKIIFEKNPGHEFYVEESFPLDWMYPYLSPAGIIMKINRQPLAELTEEMVKKDHDFWTRYSERAIGSWITYDTPVKEICDFAESVYMRGDLRGFKGDRKFVRDDNAQKAFSKLRSALGGLYAWRLTQSKTPAEQQRMLKEADFAFRQAFAFCPYSPEAVYRYVQLLVNVGRIDDALLVARTCKTQDPDNGAIQSLVEQLQGMKQSPMSAMHPTGKSLPELEQEYQERGTNLQTAFNLVGGYMQNQNTGRAMELLDKILEGASNDANAVLTVAQAYGQLGNLGRLEAALSTLVRILPGNPEAWYDLTWVQAAVGKTGAALQSFSNAIRLSDERLVQQPKAKNLRQVAAQDPRFNAVRAAGGNAPP